MNNITEDFYCAVGGSYSDAKSRLMNDTLIQKFVLKFKADQSFDKLTAAASARDIDAAFHAAHTLKGVALNLAFDRLGKCASDLTEALREANRSADVYDRLDDLFPPVQREYKIVLDSIDRYFC